MMFNEVKFLDRFREAASAGFEAVEFQFPYEHEKELVAEQLHEHDLQLVLINAPPGDWEKGERGIAALPSRSEEFRRSIHLALEYAQELACPRIHVMAGIIPQTFAARRKYVENLQYAASQAASLNIEILIEAINTRLMPGYFLDDVDLARDLLSEIGRTNVGLMFDFFHAQIIHGDVVSLFKRHIDIVRHVQIASVPDRHEPDQGDLDYKAVLRELARAGYQGWIGTEYHPKDQTLSNLDWMRTLKPNTNAERG